MSCILRFVAYLFTVTNGRFLFGEKRRLLTANRTFSLSRVLVQWALAHGKIMLTLLRSKMLCVFVDFTEKTFLCSRFFAKLILKLLDFYFLLSYLFFVFYKQCLCFKQVGSQASIDLFEVFVLLLCFIKPLFALF